MMAYLFVPFPMTLDDLEGHSPKAELIKCNSTNICATFSTGLTDTARREMMKLGTVYVHATVGYFVRVEFFLFFHSLVY